MVRNVTLGEQSIAGMRPDEVRAVAADLAARYRDAEVVVEAEGGGFRATASELGLSVLEDRTVDDALRVGRTGSVPGRVWAWARGFLAERVAPVRIAVDELSLIHI